MKNDTIYIQNGSRETNERTATIGYTRCNHWHKIHLKNVFLSLDGRDLEAQTTGKKCDCGFHCLPIESYTQEIINPYLANKPFVQMVRFEAKK